MEPVEEIHKEELEYIGLHIQVQPIDLGHFEILVLAMQIVEHKDSMPFVVGALLAKIVDPNKPVLLSNFARN